MDPFVYILHKEYKVITLGQITMNKQGMDESILLGNASAYLKVLITMLTTFQFYCKLRFLDRFIATGSKIVRFFPAALVQGILLYCQALQRIIWSVQVQTGSIFEANAMNVKGDVQPVTFE